MLYSRSLLAIHLKYSSASMSLPNSLTVLLLLLQLCPTLCYPQMAAHQSPPTLGLSRQEHEWVAISFSISWKWKVKVKLLSSVRLLATHQAPLSMGFSRQEYWSGVPLPSQLSRRLLFDALEFCFKRYQQFPLTRTLLRTAKWLRIWIWSQFVSVSATY